MGCQVQLSTEQPYFRTNLVKLDVLLHILRAIAFISVWLAVPDTFMIPLWLGAVEVIVAYWVWSLRIEAWGLSMGMAVLYLLFPSLWTFSTVGSLAVSVASAIQIIILSAIRMDGGYSFMQIYRVDTEESRIAGPIQNRMLHITIVAQAMKAIAVLFAGVMFVSFETVTPLSPWLGVLPLGPFALALGLLDLVALIQLVRGVDWGFHLTLVMVPLSVVETLVTFLAPVLLIAVWIAMLMAPCWVKDGFYARLFLRVRRNSTHPRSNQ